MSDLVVRPRSCYEDDEPYLDDDAETCPRRWLHALRDLPGRTQILKGELPAPRCPRCGLFMTTVFNNGDGGWLGCPPRDDVKSR